MKPFKAPIDEGLATDITGQMMYCLFVDVYSLSTKKGGLLLNMFPNVGAKKLYRWMGGFPNSESFSKNSELLKNMSQRFGGNSTLKTLFRVINTLKTKETEQEKNDGRINDIQLVMSKIERVIKSKLTPEEKQLFATISSELEEAADNAGKSVEGSVGASTIRPQAPQPEQPEAEPTQTAPEKTPQEPAQEPTEKPAAPATSSPAPSAPAEKPAPEEAPKEEPKEKEAPKQAPKQAPKEKPAPKEEPKAEEKPEEEEETGGKEKKESITYEEYQQHLKSLIKEIVRKKLGL